MANLNVLVPAYTYSRSITVDHTKVGSINSTDQTNFSLLISGTYAYLATVANGGKVQNTVSFNGQTVPADLFITSDAAGQNLLNWEVASYTATTGQIEIWVNVTLSHSSDTTVYLWYGNASVVTYQGGAIGTAFDSNYALVYHLSNGTTLSANDSISASNNGTVTTAVATTGGEIDGAAVFGGNSTDKITTGYSASPSQKTYSVWVYRTGGGGGTSGRVWDKRVSGAQVDELQTAANTSYQYNVQFSGGQATWAIALPSDNAWHHLAVSYDNSSASNTPIFYLDGVAVSLTTNTPSTGTVTTNTDDYVIGNRGNDNARNWQGRIDEFRISKSIRSADWISTEYKNDSAPDKATFGSSGFYTVGSESSQDVTAVTDTPQTAIANTISVSDSTAVSDTPKIEVIEEGVNVTDSTAVTDTPIIRVISYVNVTDTTAVSDIPNLEGIDQGLSVTDSTAVSDTPKVEIIYQGVVVTDSTVVSDTPSLFIFSPVRFLTVTDSTTVSDTIIWPIASAPSITFNSATAPYGIITSLTYQKTFYGNVLPVLDGEKSDVLAFRIYNNYALTPGTGTAINVQVSVYDQTAATSASTAAASQLWAHMYENLYGESTPSVAYTYTTYVGNDTPVGGTQGYEPEIGSDGATAGMIRAGDNTNGYGFLEIDSYLTPPAGVIAQPYSFVVTVFYQFTT